MLVDLMLCAGCYAAHARFIIGRGCRGGGIKGGLFMKTCWAQYLLWAVIVILGAASALSACGQKGDLYRPEPPAQSR
jgi:hypothetical protein